MIEYNVWFDVSAIAIASALLCIFSVRRSVSIVQNKVFRAMLASLWCAAVSSTVTVVWNGRLMAPVIVANYLTIICDYVLGILWLVYIMAIIDFHVHLRTVLLPLVIPTLLMLVLLAANPFTGCLFSIDGAAVFHTGPLMIASYAVYVFYLGYGVLVFVWNKRHVAPEKRLSLPLLFTIGMLGVVVEHLAPELVVQQFALALCVAIMYFTLLNPAEFFDDDTGLMNATAFETLCARWLGRGRTLQCVGVCVHDVDPVRSYTQHEELRLVERRFMATLGASCRGVLAFRVEPGCYLMVMDRADPLLADRAYTSVRRLFTNLYVGQEYQVRVSVSLCRFSCPRHASTVDGIRYLLDRVSDVGGAKGLDEVSPDALDLPREQFLRSVGELVASALPEGRLEVYYQPIWDMAERRFCAAEALLRMHDREGGLISPDVFIPIAKKNGALLDIGAFVLDEVCRVFAQNRLAGFGIRHVGVNFSVMESIQNNLPGRVEDTLRKYNLSPACLNLEIEEPESDAFDSVLDENIRQLRQVGISFSLDSFGAGAFSLHRILQLPVEVIKLSTAVVLPAFAPGHDESARLLLEGVAAMALRTGARVLAEGVESAEAAREVARLGCSYAQGYHYARPMPGEEFVAFVRERAAAGDALYMEKSFPR